MGFLDDLKGKAEEFGEKAKDKAVAESGIATETAADEVGDVGSAPAVDPLEPDERVTNSVDAPADDAAMPAEDPLESPVEAVDPVFEPAESSAVDEDPLEAT